MKEARTVCRASSLHVVMAAGKCLFGFCSTSTIRTKLVNDIFPIDSNGIDGALTPIFKNLARLSDYAADNPQHLPEICDILESLLKCYQDSGYLGFVNISLLAIRELLNRCLELESDKIIEPTVVNVLFQLFRSTNIQRVVIGFTKMVKSFLQQISLYSKKKLNPLSTS